MMTSPTIGVYANESTIIEMDHLGQPFWEAGKRGILSIPKCGACGTFRLPPLPYCGVCQASAMEWVEVAPVVELYSYTICQSKAKSPDKPGFTYIPVVVEVVDAGRVRLTGNLIAIDPANLRIGMSLELLWHPIADGWKVPIFRPASI